MRIEPPLWWDDENVEHLWRSHRVVPEEIEESIFGIAGEEPVYRVRRDGAFYVIYGETGSGRVLKMAAELLDNGRLRVFAARDMTAREKRAYRER